MLKKDDEILAEYASVLKPQPQPSAKDMLLAKQAAGVYRFIYDSMPRETFKARLLFNMYIDFCTEIHCPFLTDKAFYRSIRAMGAYRAHREDGNYWFFPFLGLER